MNNNMISTVGRFIRNRPGLTILSVILLIMTFGMIKPEFYLLGWDNFSSYLNPSHNIFNTLFAAWREHRGLGVPSDAEVNDLFRQLFSAVLSPLVGKKLIDQLYFTGMLWGGTYGMYALGRYISRLLQHRSPKQELFGFFAGFFYLFNLSTLAVFYFPMIMYNTRFFMLPTTILILLHLIYDAHISKRTYIGYLAILFVGFGAYMVPTNFIVMGILLFLFLLIMKKTKRLVIAVIFYLLLGMYWMLPFANYTIQKANIVPQAPTFITINEAMLNKPKSFYSLENQAKLRPSFFESKFTNNETSSQQVFHPLAEKDKTGWERYALWLFPTTYLLGIIYIFLFKREKILIWFSTLIIVFLMLSMKEYSSVGPLYSFLSEHIPFVNTIFRFGDTKFHAIIAFAGSIVSAFFLVQMWDISKQYIKQAKIRQTVYAAVALFMFIYIITFKSYFNGNFIGFFMYNKIPSAYFEIAEIINKDPSPVRVIQLPMDTSTYWKPYSWGYFGSAFLHFMINKPLFDRSFEPASLENSDIHKAIMDTLHMTSSVSDTSLLEDRALDLYSLLKRTSVKYIIDDGTVSVNIDSRDIAYWGAVNTIDSRVLLSYLQSKGYIKTVSKYDITSNDYANDYSKLYPYNDPSKNTQFTKTIVLYAVVNEEPHAQFVSEIEIVHSSQNLLKSARVSRLIGDYIQDTSFDTNSLIFPFVNVPEKSSKTNGKLQLTIPTTLGSGSYIFGPSDNTINENSTLLHDISVVKNYNEIKLYFTNTFYPQVIGSSISNPTLTETEIVMNADRNDYIGIKINDKVFLTKDVKDGTKFYLGSILSNSNSFKVSLLYPSNSYNISSTLVQLEQNPQCFNDGIGETESHITGDRGILHIWGENVSNCLTTQVKLENPQDSISFIELQFNASGVASEIKTSKHIDTGKPLLNNEIHTLANPLTLYVCVKIPGIDECLNKTIYVQGDSSKKNYTIPIVGDLSDIDKLNITFAVKNGQPQSYDVTFTTILLKTYKEGSPNLYSPDKNIFPQDFTLNNSSQLFLLLPIAESSSYPLAISHSTYMYRTDLGCYGKNKDQAIKQTQQGLLTYVVGCRNFIQTTIPYSTNNFYYWFTIYKHLSGEIPSIILMDRLNTYYLEKLLPYGVDAGSYFATPLQKPDTLLTTKKTIERDSDSTPISFSSGYVIPRNDLQDVRNKEFIIQHNSENSGHDGLSELRELDLIELPNYWYTSKIRPLTYSPMRITNNKANIELERLLPSLWRVKTVSQGGKQLLLFNEAYDKQWQLFGINTELHTKCNGFANCYVINLSAENTSFYIFYLPELLNVLGWIITVLTIIGGLFQVERFYFYHSLNK